MSDVFVPGDVVKLKSGGEAMTVEEIDGTDVSCVWQDGKKIERNSFPAVTLKKYVPATASLALGRR